MSVRLRRKPVVLLALLLGTTACPSSKETAPPPAPEDRPPDLIVITVDTMRADHLGSYGHAPAKTRAMDALAAAGVRFAHATAPTPRTTPSLATLMTGRIPPVHGSREVGEPMDPSLPTLASVLQGAGYHTAAVLGNGAAGPKQGLDRGFEDVVRRKDLDDDRARTVVDAALGLVKKAPTDKPLFLWVHLMDPHWFYDPPEDELKEQPQATECRKLTQMVKDGHLVSGHLYSNRGDHARRALQACKLLYDAELEYTDVHLGRLTKGLHKHGRIAGALVVLTSDHGENQGEDGLYYEHGPSVNDAAIRVPLIISGPGIRPGQVDDRLARLEDVMPTMLAYADVPAPPTEGLDLFGDAPPREIAVTEGCSALHRQYTLALVAGRANRRHCAHGEGGYALCRDPGGPMVLRHPRAPGADLKDEETEVFAKLKAQLTRWPPQTAKARTARDTRYKLVERPRAEGGYSRSLYDLKNDPKELTDLSATHPEEVERLGAAIETWLALGKTQSPQAPDAETEAALKSLGYVQ